MGVDLKIVALNNRDDSPHLILQEPMPPPEPINTLRRASVRLSPGQE
jgi:hypothetical protein